MDRRRFVLMSLAVVTAPGNPSWAWGEGSGSGGQVEGMVRAIYKAQRLVVLADGTEFRAADPRQLDQVHEGMTVKIDYLQTGGRKLINFIVPAP